MLDSQQRAHEIVEELRADIDFEIDDVISQIVLGLPEDYFRVLARSEQMKHLKALLALGVCNVDQDVMMPSDDEKFIAVVARKNHPGLLAKILKRLPNPQELVGAKIFTSKEQDFIIDLFEFKSEEELVADAVKHVDLEQKLVAVARLTGQPQEQIAHFASQYEPNSPVLDNENDLASQFVAFKNVLALEQLSVQLDTRQSPQKRQLTVATDSANAFEVFTQTACFLADQSCDVDQAVLNNFFSATGKPVSIASFKIAAEPVLQVEQCESEISKLLLKA